MTATEQASKGRTTLIPLLLEHGARAGARDSLGSTPLHRAAAAGKVRLDMARHHGPLQRAAITWAWGCGPSVNTPKAQAGTAWYSGNVPAVLCSSRWWRSLQVEAIKALLGRSGVSIDATDKQGQTPLMLAVRAQQQPAALALTAAGASLDVSLCTLLHMCVLSCYRGSHVAPV